MCGERVAFRSSVGGIILWEENGGSVVVMLLGGNTVAPLDRVPVFIVSSVMNIQLWALS